MSLKASFPFYMPIGWLAASLFCLLFGGCATIDGPQIRTGIRLSPASFGRAISLHQSLSVNQNGHTYVLEIALEIDPSRIDLVGLAMGQRVLALHFDGSQLVSSRHFMLPKEVQAEDVLENLQLALWPEEAIREALPPEWQMEVSDRKRFFYFKGVRIIEIHYSNALYWLGTIEMHNQPYNYHLTIQSVQLSP
ncbi:MAG: DUF3261 domain-containing protein [Betaproteobacteria bacterium]|nr:DUF3261 domain-containing protein [Betaproteobacteria bacterium]